MVGLCYSQRGLIHNQTRLWRACKESSITPELVKKSCRAEHIHPGQILIIMAARFADGYERRWCCQCDWSRHAWGWSGGHTRSIDAAVADHSVDTTSTAHSSLTLERPEVMWSLAMLQPIFLARNRCAGHSQLICFIPSSRLTALTFLILPSQWLTRDFASSLTPTSLLTAPLRALGLRWREEWLLVISLEASLALLRKTPSLFLPTVHLRQVALLSAVLHLRPCRPPVHRLLLTQCVLEGSYRSSYPPRNPCTSRLTCSWGAPLCSWRLPMPPADSRSWLEPTC